MRGPQLVSPTDYEVRICDGIMILKKWSHTVVYATSSLSLSPFRCPFLLVELATARSGITQYTFFSALC
jgi:hypothetical protein